MELILLHSPIPEPNHSQFPLMKLILGYILKDVINNLTNQDMDLMLLAHQDKKQEELMKKLVMLLLPKFQKEKKEHTKQRLILSSIIISINTPLLQYTQKMETLNLLIEHLMIHIKKIKLNYVHLTVVEKEFVTLPMEHAHVMLDSQEQIVKQLQRASLLEISSNKLKIDKIDLYMKIYK